MAITYLELANLFQYWVNDFASAREFYDEIYGLAENGSLAKSSLVYINGAIHKALLIGSNIDYSQAEIVLDEGFSWINPLSDLNYSTYSLMYKVDGIINYGKLENELSETSLQKGIEIIKKYESEKAFELGRLYNNLGILYQYTDREKDAVKLYNESIEINSSYPFNEFRLANVYLNYGEYHYQNGDFVNAKSYWEQSLKLRNRVFGNYNIEQIHTAAHLSNLARESGKIDDAIHINQEILAVISPGYDVMNINSMPETKIYFLEWLPTYLFFKASLLEDKFERTEDFTMLELAHSNNLLADKVFQDARSSFALSDSKSFFTEQFYPNYEEAILLAIRAHEISGDQIYLDDALHFLRAVKKDKLLQQTKALSDR